MLLPGRGSVISEPQEKSRFPTRTRPSRSPMRALPPFSASPTRNEARGASPFASRRGDGSRRGVGGGRGYRPRLLAAFSELYASEIRGRGASRDALRVSRKPGHLDRDFFTEAVRPSLRSVVPREKKKQSLYVQRSTAMTSSRHRAAGDRKDLHGGRCRAASSRRSQAHRARAAESRRRGAARLSPATGEKKPVHPALYGRPRLLGTRGPRRSERGIIEVARRSCADEKWNDEFIILDEGREPRPKRGRCYDPNRVRSKAVVRRGPGPPQGKTWESRAAHFWSRRGDPFVSRRARRRPPSIVQSSTA